jgi:dTDP-4-dehydrorhamnose 3,5-epimerase
MRDTNPPDDRGAIGTDDRFTIEPTPLDGLVVVTRHPRRDERGSLERLFCEHDLASLLPAGRRIVQVNRTCTRTPGTIRGMHFQRPPHAELKIVSCLRGAVFDVAVDLRPWSTTFLEWHGVTLEAEAHTALVIPEGFAHGFQSLVADTELLYFHTAAWTAGAEGALHALDPALAIRWPLPVAAMSDRDRTHPFVAADRRATRSTWEEAA